MNFGQIARRSDISEPLSFGVDTPEASVQAERDFLDTDFTWRQAVPVDRREDVQQQRHTAEGLAGEKAEKSGSRRCPVPAISNSQYRLAAMAG